MDDPNSAQSQSSSGDQQTNMNQTKKATNNETIVNRNNSTLMPAPLNPEFNSTRNYQRKRKQNHAIGKFFFYIWEIVSVY